MSIDPERHYSVDDYFAVEETSPLKHEYYRGEIFAMAGASLEHIHITGNLLTLLRTALRGGRCNAFGTDLRILTASGFYTYPDLAVICGQVELAPGRPATATNPVVLVEVLSDATRDYDRGEKFDLYKTIRTLRDYVLVEQSSVSVERFSLAEAGWRREAWSSLDARAHLPSVGVELPVSEIYRNVFPG